MSLPSALALADCEQRIADRILAARDAEAASGEE